VNKCPDGTKIASVITEEKFMFKNAQDKFIKPFDWRLRACNIFLAGVLTAFSAADASAITWGELIEFGTGVYVHSMRRTFDGGIILSVSQNHVAKLRANGEIDWQKTGISHAVESPDGGIAAIGVRNGRWFLTKFNNAGNMVWQKTYNFETSGPVVFTHVRTVGAAGYILAGSEFSRTEPRKCVLLRTGSQGNPLWLKKYSGFNLRDMETVPNASFILVGRPNVTVLNISASGQLLFKGSFGAGSEEPVSIQPTLDGNFVVASNRRKNPIQSFITKFSNSGKILWRESFSGLPRINLTSVRSITEGYLVAGSRRAPNEPNQDMFIMRLNNNGIFQFADYFGGTASEFGFAIATLDNHFAIAGSTISSNTGNEAGFVMKFPRNENAGNFCSFFKPHEQQFIRFFVQPVPPIIPRTQTVENVHIAAEDTNVPISDANLQFAELCE
jgi:hypothetical protein